MLDYSFFERIGLSSNEDLIKFFGLYLEAVPKYLLQLEKAAELGDLNTFREINHKLKPNLIYFPDPQVNEIMQFIQGKQSIENIRRYLPLLKEHLSNVIQQVEIEKERLKNE